LVAASSLGKWPLVLSTLRNCMCKLSMELYSKVVDEEIKKGASFQ
jgi:hypothetical protein